MSNKRFYTGQAIRRFPNKTWDRLVDHVERDDAAGPKTIGQERGQLAPITVLITETIAAATWEAGTLTPQLVEVELFAAVDGLRIERSGEKVYLLHMFTSEVTVTAGKGKIGKAIGGHLFNVDCNEVTL